MTTAESDDALFKAVGARIRALRVASGASQEDFARLCGFNPKYMWRIEDGRQNLNLKTLSRIAKALQLEIGELLSGVERLSGDDEN